MSALALALTLALALASAPVQQGGGGRTGAPIKPTSACTMILRFLNSGWGAPATSRRRGACAIPSLVVAGALGAARAGSAGASAPAHTRSRQRRLRATVCGNSGALPTPQPLLLFPTPRLTLVTIAVELPPKLLWCGRRSCGRSAAARWRCRSGGWLAYALARVRVLERARVPIACVCARCVV